MDFNSSEEQILFRDSVSRFAERELAPGALARAHEDSYPWEVAEKMAAQGLFGISFPEKVGGHGGTLMDSVIAIQAVAHRCPRSADVIQAGNFGAVRVLADFGTPDLHERFLKNMLTGKQLIAVAMTEPEAGSAATELKTAATPDGSGYRIKGTKVFTTHGRHATHFLVYVRFGPGASGIGCILVARDADGVSFGKAARFMSGESWVQIYFEDTYVGSEDVVLGPGGFKKQMSAFNIERLGNSARALALGQYAFNVAREHALVRRQFNRLLCEFQGIQWKFSDMQVALDAAQLLLWRAAANADRGYPSPYETSIAKYACNKAGFEASVESMQILGGLGFSEESLVEYCMRRTRGWMIAGGSLEMMRNRIAEGIFDRHFSQRPPRESAAQ